MPFAGLCCCGECFSCDDAWPQGCCCCDGCCLPGMREGMMLSAAGSQSMGWATCLLVCTTAASACFKILEGLLPDPDPPPLMLLDCCTSRASSFWMCARSLSDAVQLDAGLAAGSLPNWSVAALVGTSALTLFLLLLGGLEGGCDFDASNARIRRSRHAQPSSTVSKQACATYTAWRPQRLLKQLTK